MLGVAATIAIIAPYAEAAVEDDLRDGDKYFEDGNWQKRDERTGHFMPVKDDGTPWKGVAKEPDGRDTDNS